MAGIDYSTQQVAVDRKRAIADYLMKQAVQPMGSVMSEGRHVDAGWGQAIAPILQALMGNYASGKADSAASELAASKQQGMQDELSQFMAAKGDAGEAGQQAIVRAMSSQFPQLQQAGSAGMNSFMAPPERVPLKDLAKLANPREVLADPSNAGGTWTAPQKFEQVDGQLYDPNAPGGPSRVQLQGPGPTQVMIEGDLYEANPSTGSLRKLDNAAKTTVNNNINASPVIAGQKAGMEAAFKHGAATVDAMGQEAKTSSNLVQTLDELQRLEQAGLNSNITSDLVTGVANLGQALGMPVDVNALGNTEAYNAAIIGLWQQAVSQFGGNRGVTKEEAAEIKKMLPLAQFSPEARKLISDIQRRGAGRLIQGYKEANSSFMEAAAADDPRLIKIPNYMEQTYLPAASQNRPLAEGQQPKVLKLNELSVEQKANLMQKLQGGQ